VTATPLEAVQQWEIQRCPSLAEQNAFIASDGCVYFVCKDSTRDTVPVYGDTGTPLVPMRTHPFYFDLPAATLSLLERVAASVRSDPF